MNTYGLRAFSRRRGTGDIRTPCVLAVALAAAALLSAPAAFGVDIGILGSGSGEGPCTECFSNLYRVVRAGDAVTWHNQEATPHTVVSATAQPGIYFYSGILWNGDSFSHTFEEPGEYGYFCTLHPWMVGTVSVLPEPTGHLRLISQANDLFDVEMYSVDGEPYAIVTSFVDSAMLALDVSNRGVLDVGRYGVGGFDVLDGPQDVEVFRSGGAQYAMLASYAGDAVQIVNVTDPARIEPVAAAIDGVGGFEALGGARDIAIYRHGGETYAYVTSVADDAVQIMDVTDPVRPAPAGVISDRSLATSPLDATVLDVRGASYLLVTGTGEVGAQVLDVSDPTHPVRVGIVLDDHAAFPELSGATDVQGFRTVSGVFATVARAYDNSVVVLNVTNPSDPAVVGVASDGDGGFDFLGGVRDVELFRAGDKTYAVTASPSDRALQIMDVTDPSNPVPVSAVTEGAEGLFRPWDVEMSPSGTLALVVGDGGDAFQVVSFEDPAAPRVVGYWTQYAGRAP